jgi:hypothetical protein
VRGCVLSGHYFPPLVFCQSVSVPDGQTELIPCFTFSSQLSFFGNYELALKKEVMGDYLQNNNNNNDG